MGCILTLLCKNDKHIFTYDGTPLPSDNHSTPYKKLYNRTFVGRQESTGSVYIIPFNSS